MGHENREVDDFWGGKGPVRMREEQWGLHIYIWNYTDRYIQNHHNETHYSVSYLKQQKQVNQCLCFIVVWIRNDLTLNVWTFGPSVHWFRRLQEVEPWWGSVSLRMGFAVCQPRPTFCSLLTSWVQMNCEQLGSYSCSQVFAVTLDWISYWNCKTKSTFPPQSCCMSRFFIATTGN